MNTCRLRNGPAPARVPPVIAWMFVLAAATPLSGQDEASTLATLVRSSPVVVRAYTDAMASPAANGTHRVEFAVRERLVGRTPARIALTEPGAETRRWRCPCCAICATLATPSAPNSPWPSAVPCTTATSRLHSDSP